MRFYRQYQPGAPLSELIECYWVFRAPGESGGVERLIPGGRVEMIFHFGSPFQLLAHPDSPAGEQGTSVHFMGQRDRVFFGSSKGYTDMLGVRFKPGGLAAFTPIPLAELLNRLIPADYILGNAIKGWEDRLFELGEDSQRVLLLDQLLSGLIRELPADKILLRPVLATIRNYPDELSIQAVCEQTGWYYKKLERSFKETVGYTPKQYCRILRFNKAIRQMGRFKEVSLTKVGYACGYYDQSHFIKDFSRYTGITPGSFSLVDHSMADYLIRHQLV
ncbi:MAG TPA: AraC family transcriptional regulator [Puia sp.]|nr:AraC family transcriptional regulator [Puia sp.]